MKKIAMKESTATLLLLSLAALSPSFSTFAQTPIKKEIKVIVVTDTLNASANDTTFIVDGIDMDNAESAAWEEININLDSINYAVRKEINDINIEIDSIPMEIDIPDLEFLDPEIELAVDDNRGSVITKKIEIQRVNNSDPKALEETLRKLELEGKITTKGEFTGVKTISITKGDKLTEHVWLQPKGKNEWIDAKTGQPAQIKHRVVRMPRIARHSRMIFYDSDSTNLQCNKHGNTRHVYLSHGNGKTMNIRIMEGDSLDARGGYSARSKDTIIIRKHVRNGRNRLFVTTNSEPDENIEVTVICNDSTKAVRHGGKNIMVRANGEKHKGKQMRTRTYTIRVESSDNITKEEKSMLEKSGFKKEKEGKHLSPENLSVYPNPTDGKFNVVFKGEGKGTLLLKISDSNGKMFVNEKETVVNGSFEKDYSLETPTDGIYFIQTTFDGKSTTKKIIVKK